MVITQRTTRRIRILIALVIGLVMSAPLLYMLAGSLMSNSQLSIQPPQVIPSSLHFGNYPAAFSGLTQVIQVRSFVNSVDLHRRRRRPAVAFVHHGGLVIAKMRFRSRGLITALFAVSLFIPLLTTLIPTFVVTYKLGIINTYPGLDSPDRGADRVRVAAVPPVHQRAAPGAVRCRPHGRRQLVADAAPTRDSAGKAGDGGVSGDLGADGVEHVPVAARGRGGKRCCRC